MEILLLLALLELFLYSCCFTPLGLIWEVLNKIKRECQLALLITPLWPTQNWLPAILRQATGTPQIFSTKHLQLPRTAKKHPLV